MKRVVVFLTLSLPVIFPASALAGGAWTKGDVSAPQKVSPTQTHTETKPAPQAGKHSLPLALKK